MPHNIQQATIDFVDFPGEVNIDNVTRLNGRLGNSIHGYRHAGDWSLPWLWGSALTYPNGVYGEIGFRDGLSAMAFCLAARETKGRVYSIDVSECDQGIANLKTVGLDTYHTFLRGNSQDGSTVFPEPLDVLYIDGDHTYEGVKADYELHAPMVKPGGVIFFHDPAIWPHDVGRYLVENGIFFLPIGCGIGVKFVPFGPNQTTIREELQDKPVMVAVA